MQIEWIRLQIAYIGMDVIYLSLGRNKGFMSCNLATLDRSYCCGQVRPFCGGPVHLMDVADHKGHTIEVRDSEALEESWKTAEDSRGNTITYVLAP